MTSKVFIVTGASKGIGAAITQHLLQNSHNVVLAARSEAPLKSVKQARPNQVAYVAGDMTSSDMAPKLAELAVQTFGRIDGIVINHGTMQPCTISQSSIQSWKNVYNVNVFSCVAMAQAGLTELRKTQGCIVWVSSGAAIKPYKAWSAYGSSKAAVNSISSHLAAEEPEITSVAVAPGRVDTDMQALIRKSGADSMDKAQYDNFVEVFQNGGLLKPEKPGNVIAKLVAQPSKALSGTFLNWNSPELAAYQE
ncbi:hypothetical protein CDD82_4748 [Ophiocordyceps australis]|uniref:Ketoreductase domain-containing protein n=1 Tax=Ophiocordyceps australis TaxID=1399860 RepID=A0A2C5Z4W2_9HYPO|nr:hypothetical protein CDD82_4748 [Ophiocordyceps australis]